MLPFVLTTGYLGFWPWTAQTMQIALVGLLTTLPPAIGMASIIAVMTRRGRALSLRQHVPLLTVVGLLVGTIAAAWVLRDLGLRLWAEAWWLTLLGTSGGAISSLIVSYVWSRAAR